MIKEDGKTQMYKSEEHIDADFVNAKTLTTTDLKTAGFFGANRNFFIQIVKDSDLQDGGVSELNPHYFHLKRLCRKKSQPLYIHKIHADTFGNGQDKEEIEKIL